MLLSYDCLFSVFYLRGFMTSWSSSSFLHACFYMHVFFMDAFTYFLEALSHHNLATAAISKAHDVDATLGGLLNLHAVDGVDGDRSVG